MNTFFDYYIVYLFVNYLYILLCLYPINKYMEPFEESGFIGYREIPDKPMNLFYAIFTMGFLFSYIIVGHILGTLKQIKYAFLTGSANNYPMNKKSLDKNMYRNKVISGFYSMHFGLLNTAIISLVIIAVLIKDLIVKLVNIMKPKKKVKRTEEIAK